MEDIQMPDASDVEVKVASPDELDEYELYSLLQDAITGRITAEILIFKLNDILNSVTDKSEVIDSLADVIVQCDLETSIASKTSREMLLAITKNLIKSDILPVDLSRERFEIDTGAQLDIIGDKKQFATSYNRIRTKLYFKQRKYNLLRESNEGFAKILTELSLLTNENVQTTLSTIREIIGQYRVDPNRVLDLVLDIFEYDHTNFDKYVELLKLFYFHVGKITQLLQLKLSFYSSNQDEFKSLPQTLYRIIAILIHKEIIDLDDIYPSLSPLDSSILEYHKKLVDEARSLSRKYAMAHVGDEKPTKTVVDSLSDVERHMLEIDNQKLHLCAHLIDIGEWDQALMLAKRLPEFYCFSQGRIARTACDLVNYLIDPIYRQCALPEPLNHKISPAPARKHAPPQFENVLDVQNKLFPMLTALGPFVSADPLLLTKIIRLLKYLLKLNQNSVEIEKNGLYYQILDVINESILPATTLTEANSSLSRELWTLIKNFDYHIRYKLYYNWRDEGSNPVMLRNRGQILLRAKHHMKRLSKETLRFTARHIGKLCYSNPVITLNYILVQIQSYDNLISLVVDSLRFLPPLATDCLIYCIIEALSDPHKNKKSMDGMALAPWLTSLSSFSANIILRYKVEFTGFLEYIANQLKAGSSLDLVLLTDLIQKMTGIETIQAITDDRIEALMGGDVLRTEGAYFNQVKNTRKSSARLKDALIESRLAMPLCISIAQLRDSQFFNQQDKTPLKLVGKLYDQCQETLVQYGVFLSMNLSIDDYINFLPPLDKLMTDYKLDPDSAFFLARPMIFHKIKSKFAELKEESTKSLSVEEEGEAPELSTQTLYIRFVEAAKSVIDPIAEAIQPSLIEKYGTINLKAKLFVIFWTLSMSDLEVPHNCYEREIQRLKTTLSELSKSNDDEPKRKKEKDRCSNLIQKLKLEQADQEEHTRYIKMYIESEKKNLYWDRSSCSIDQVYLESRQFIQYCPIARSTLTAYDAIYSSRFIMLLHELRVDDHSTIICLDRLLCDLTYTMGACTENEANHYGRFLCNILKTIAHWHSDISIFTEECENYPGSIINFGNTEHINYEKYRDITYKWHYRLTKSFTISLESNNYIQIRNALIVMTKIIDVYPAIKHFGKGIGMKIEDVRNTEKENRQDLYALATSYAGKLDERRPHLIPEASFHIVEKKPKNDTIRNETKNESKLESKNETKGEPKSEAKGDPKVETRNDTSSSSNSNIAKPMRSSSSSRPSSKTRPASPTSHRERHSSSNSRKKARHS